MQPQAVAAFVHELGKRLDTVRRFLELGRRMIRPLPQHAGDDRGAVEKGGIDELAASAMEPDAQRRADSERGAEGGAVARKRAVEEGGSLAANAWLLKVQPQSGGHQGVDCGAPVPRMIGSVTGQAAMDQMRKTRSQRFL